MADEQDDMLKAKFAKLLKIHHLGSYLNMNVITDLYNKAKHSSVEDMVSNPENMEDSE